MAEEAKEQAGGAAAAEELDLGEFSDLLEKDFRVAESESDKLKGLVANLALAAQEKAGSATISSNAVKSIKSLIGGIDALLSEQMNEVLHAPEVREIEGTWRGLHYLVNNTETDQKLKIKVMNIKKGQTVTLSIMNLYKDDSMYGQGQKPYFFSTKANSLEGKSWR